MSHNTRRDDRRSRRKKTARETIDEIVRALRPKTRCYHCAKRTTMNSYFDVYEGRVYPPICYECFLNIDDADKEMTSCALGECSNELLEAALSNIFIDPMRDPSKIVWN